MQTSRRFLRSRRDREDEKECDRPTDRTKNESVGRVEMKASKQQIDEQSRLQRAKGQKANKVPRKRLYLHFFLFQREKGERLCLCNQLTRWNAIEQVRDLIWMRPNDTIREKVIIAHAFSFFHKISIDDYEKDKWLLTFLTFHRYLPRPINLQLNQTPQQY